MYNYTRANNTHRFKLTLEKLFSHGFYHMGYFSIEVYHFWINTFLHWQNCVENKKRLLQGVLVGLTLGLFYHMKITFEKEMFLLSGVIDLC